MGRLRWIEASIPTIFVNNSLYCEQQSLWQDLNSSLHDCRSQLNMDRLTQLVKERLMLLTRNEMFLKERIQNKKALQR